MYCCTYCGVPEGTCHKGNCPLLSIADLSSLPPARTVSAVTEAPSVAWPDPTPEMLDNRVFNAIWSVIKTWDINVPGAYHGYCCATGNHARAIYDALHQRL